MKNSDLWVPSKFVLSNGKLRASRDSKEVSVSSRLITDIIAKYYYDYIPKFVSGNLVDLGCGKVPLYAVYKNYITNNVCIDWENSYHKNIYLDKQHDLTLDLPFMDNEFDTIILSDVLEHIPEPWILWMELNRILVPKGKILLNIPFFYCLHETPHDYYRYTEFAIRKFAEKYGFTILVFEAIGGVPEIIADILAKQLRYIPFIGKSIAITIQNVTNLFVKIGIGKWMSKKSSKFFPLGYFMVVEKK